MSLRMHPPGRLYMMNSYGSESRWSWSILGLSWHFPWAVRGVPRKCQPCRPARATDIWAWELQSAKQGLRTPKLWAIVNCTVNCVERGRKRPVLL